MKFKKSVLLIYFLSKSTYNFYIFVFNQILLEIWQNLAKFIRKEKCWNYVFLKAKDRSGHYCLVPLWVQNHFGLSKPFWPSTNGSFCFGPNHYEQVQITKICLEKSNLNLTKIIWHPPKQFGQSKIILDL